MSGERFILRTATVMQQSDIAKVYNMSGRPVDYHRMERLIRKEWAMNGWKLCSRASLHDNVIGVDDRKAVQSCDLCFNKSPFCNYCCRNEGYWLHPISVSK